MEALVLLAVLYAWFSVIRKAIQGQKARNQKEPRRTSPAGASPAPAAHRQGQKPQARQGQKPIQAAPSPAKPGPARQPASQKAGAGEGMSKGYAPMQTHMSELLKEEDDLKRRQAGQGYTGSLGGGSLEGATSQEGEDACDPSLGHGSPALPDDGESVYDPPIGGEGGLAWNSASLVQGVVMSEILKRPAQRKWGRA